MEREGLDGSPDGAVLSRLLLVLATVLGHCPVSPRLRLMRDDCVGHALALGLVHRVDDLFSLFDRPQVRLALIES